MNAKYHFYGHWHEGVTSEKRNRYNCSLLNDSYYLKYKPVIVNIMTDKEKNDLLNEIIVKINKEIDSNGSELSFNEVATVDEIIDIITSFMSVPTADQEDEISWDDVITADTTIENQLNNDNNESG